MGRSKILRESFNNRHNILFLMVSHSEISSTRKALTSVQTQLKDLILVEKHLVNYYNAISAGRNISPLVKSTK